MKEEEKRRKDVEEDGNDKDWQILGGYIRREDWRNYRRNGLVKKICRRIKKKYRKRKGKDGNKIGDNKKGRR